MDNKELLSIEEWCNFKDIHCYLNEIDLEDAKEYAKYCLEKQAEVIAEEAKAKLNFDYLGQLESWEVDKKSILNASRNFIDKLK